MINANNIVKKYKSKNKEFIALNSVSLEIKENEFFTLLGPSGCGKTTLLRLIAGFEQPTSGEILLDKQNINHLLPYQRPINTVFQSYSLFPHMTVFDNIGFGLEMQGVSKTEQGNRIQEMLELVKLTEFSHRMPSQLSGGQQQRIALARALACKPKVLLLDEPLSALDLKLRKNMQIELKSIQVSTQTTFVFVTHDQEEALTMSDRIAVMQQGNILQIGSPNDIYENPNSKFVADFIGDSNFISATYSGDNRFQINCNQAIHLASNDHTLDSNAKVTLAIRPEKVLISKEQHTDNLNTLEGIVKEVIYIGSNSIIKVQLDEENSIMVRQQNTFTDVDQPKRDSKIRLTFPQQAIRIIAS